MQHQTTLAIPQPCSESWDAMTPAAQGRHCAACQKTVVDFTLKTDAEILAYLAKAAAGRTCGRFAAGQLERPLQRAAPVAPTTRWRAWLAAAVAVWGVREAMSVAANAQAPIEMRRMGNAVATPENMRAERKPDYEGQSVKATVLRGIAKDYGTGEGLPGVSVIIKGSKVGTSTNIDGSFELVVPADYATTGIVTLQIFSLGYLMQERQVLMIYAEQVLQFRMEYETKGAFEYTIAPPAPWHPRSFYQWGKYWVTRPFQR